MRGDGGRALDDGTPSAWRPRARHRPQRLRAPCRSYGPSRRCPPGRGRRCRTRSATARTPARVGATPGGCAPSTLRGSAATSRRGAARGPPRPSVPRGRRRCRRRRTPAAPCRPARRVPVDVLEPSSSSFSSSPGKPSMTPGKFIISARPSTRRRRISASRSPAVSARRGDSNGEAGTQDGAMKKISSWRSADASSSQWTPSTPSTFAISCGSATTAVVPSGRTSRANSSTSSFTDSRCMCASMKPGTTQLPTASTVSRPSYSPSPAITPSTTATSASSHSRVNTESTRPPPDDEVGGLVAAGDGKASAQTLHATHPTAGARTVRGLGRASRTCHIVGRSSIRPLAAAARSEEDI